MQLAWLIKIMYWCVFSTRNALISRVCSNQLCEPVSSFICLRIINIATSKNRSEESPAKPPCLSLTSYLNILPHVAINCWSFSDFSMSESDRPFGLWTMPECIWHHANRKVNCWSIAAESGNEAVLSSQQSFHIVIKSFNCYSSGIEVFVNRKVASE